MLSKLYSWYGKTTVRLIGVIILALMVTAVFTLLNQSDEDRPEEPVLPTVTVASANTLSGASPLSLIGQVASVSEAKLESEVGGRITSVPVELGASVRAGQIIATIENASEAAVVLQAEGSYEAALAAAAQSDVGTLGAETALKAAQNNVLDTVRSVYSSSNSVLINTIDDVFTDPTGAFPGLRIVGGRFTSTLNQRRISLQTIIPDWKNQIDNLTTTSDLEQSTTQATENVQVILSMVNDLIVLATDTNNQDRMVAGADIDTYRSRLTTTHSSLVMDLNKLESAATNLNAAEDKLRQAQIGGTNADLSSANAQIKQALGSLRSAQANYAKTIIRTPIAGTLNELEVKTGDFISPATSVAIIANNNALEITTFVGESDRASIAIGDEVTIENMYPGTITNIAPAVNSETKKIEVKISTEADELANGDTVRIKKASVATTTDGSDPLYVPLSAVRFSADAGSVFIIENDVLVAKPVTLGTIRGAYIEIVTGIAADQVIVTDARGLAAGQSVEAVNQN